MSLLAAIDQGTTGTRCFLFDLSGRVVASAYREHAQAFPHPGWVEHDPLEIRDNVERVVGEAIAAGPREPVLALGVTNQRETVVLWDARSGLPIAPAIVWQDTRTEADCRALIAAGFEEDVRARTGLPIRTYFSATKIRWLLANVPGGEVPRRLRPSPDRHHGLLGDLESDRRSPRRSPRDRSDERLAHPPLRARQSRMGPGTARPIRSAGGASGSDRALDRGGALRLDSARWTLRRADPGVRGSRRPAGGALRAGVFSRRRGEEHLRHRLLPPPAHRRHSYREPLRPPDDRGRRAVGRARLRARRIGRRHRIRRPMAPRRPRHRRDRRGDRAPRALGPEHRRRLFRPGVLRSLRPPLGHDRPRHDRGPDPLRDPRPSRARDPRSDRLPEPRSPRGDGLRQRPLCRSLSRWTAAPPRTTS